MYKMTLLYISGQKRTNPGSSNNGSSRGGDNRKGKRKKISNALKDFSAEDSVSDVSVAGRRPQSQRRSSRLHGKERAGKQGRVDFILQNLAPLICASSCQCPQPV